MDFLKIEEAPANLWILLEENPIYVNGTILKVLGWILGSGFIEKFHLSKIY